VLRGTRAAGLIRYLYGPGRHEEHTDPRLVAGWRDPAELEPLARVDGKRDFRRLHGLLNQPLAALGRRGFGKPVWHCVARAAPDHPVLSDSQWARIAEEIMHRMGLARPGDDDAVRWIAVRHAPDHIHIVATLARQDGTRPRIWNDFYRVHEACQAVERRYGLRVTAPGDRTAGRRPTRAENEHARRRGWEEPARPMLRRAVHTAAAGASSEQEFFTRLEAAGLLVRKRFSQRDRGQVTGYAVAKPRHVSRQCAPVWFGGGKLAADLTLPKLRERWLAMGPASTRRVRPGARLSAEERRHVWNGQAILPPEPPARSGRAPSPIRQRLPMRPGPHLTPCMSPRTSWVAGRSGRQQTATPARLAAATVASPGLHQPGNRLRATARLLAFVATVGEQDQAAVMMLVAELAELAVAVAELRDIQRHAAQASAARTAAERLRAATCAGPSQVRPANARPAVRPHRRVRTAANLARLDFPNAFKSPRTAARESPRQEAAQPPVPSRASQPRRPGGPSQ
jgi:hypothetical protein